MSNISQIHLTGKRKLTADVSSSDLPALSKYTWGWHPRGVFDHKRQKLLTKVLFPKSKKVLYRDKNPLNCTRENLMPTGSDFAEECNRRKAHDIKFKGTRSRIEGVFLNKEETKLLVFRKSRGIRFCKCISLQGNIPLAYAEAVELRKQLLKMSHKELIQWKKSQ